MGKLELLEEGINMTMWTKLRLRKADAEECEFYGSEWVWDEPTPEDDERVLVSDGVNVWIDTWVYFGDREGGLENELDNGEGLYWAPLPEPPKKEKWGVEKKRCGL